MRARDLAEDYPLVQLTDDAMTAARLIAEQRRPGVVVVDDENHPVTVLPGSQVLRFIVPGYVQEDPSLARVYDERGGAEACVNKLEGRMVKELLPPKEKRHEIPKVSGDATVIECAATMARLHSPLLLVTDDDTIHGVVTASHLLEVILSTSGTNP
ncbi:CBS domain-containing protein [Saccharothrix deserti]|uniref:CBS domain-containing protein n=1 Tax=Saccharothrix deserti TaxID=2593674 RepID=UPI00131CA329|nr:CBS domain-containing protein [Saccharothrix deserti]